MLGVEPAQKLRVARELRAVSLGGFSERALVVDHPADASIDERAIDARGPDRAIFLDTGERELALGPRASREQPAPALILESVPREHLDLRERSLALGGRNLLRGQRGEQRRTLFRQPLARPARETFAGNA